MEEIISVNGQEYVINTTQQLTQEQKNNVINQISKNMESLATGCPPGPIPVGTNKTFTCSATGIGPFTFTLTVNSVVVHTSVPTTSPYTIPGGYTFSTVGTYPVVLTVKDSCAGSTLTGTDQCATVNVVERTLASITISGCDTSISTSAPGNTCLLSVTGLDQFGSPFTPTFVAYTSGTPTVATAGAGGGVTGVNAGTSVITATAQPNNRVATKTVTVTCGTPTCSFTMA